MKNILPIKPCLAQKNEGVSRGDCWQQILYLVVISRCLSNNSLFWPTDNFTARKILESGSSKPELQMKAVKKEKAFHICIWKIWTSKYPALVWRAMWKLIECDDNIGKFYLQTCCRKMEYYDCWLLCILWKLEMLQI